MDKRIIRFHKVLLVTKTISTHFINPFLRGESPDSIARGCYGNLPFPSSYQQNVSATRALRDVSLDFMSGEVHCLPGKTAVVNRR